MASDYPYIVADIGGTNARFGLVTQNKETGEGFVIDHKQKYPSNQFENIEYAAQHYIDSLNGLQVSGACLAVAGPITGDAVNLTNLNWAFSIKDVMKSLGLEKLKVINDFAAYAFATRHVLPEHLLSLNEGQSIEGCPIAIVGPGTGFGVAALVPQADRWNVLPTEGGHITLAAKNSLQASIIAVLSQQFSHISVERVLSGPGLKNLYQAYAKVEGIQVEELRSSEITANALSNANSLEHRTLSLFCAWLGQTCGDLALNLGARGGVYLGGGVLLRFTDFLLDSEFMSCFIAKGQMQEYLQQMPVKLVTEGNSALLGAASWFKD